MATKWYKHPIKKNNWITEKQYFNIMFGEEFMNSEDKGTLKEYKEKE